MSWNKANDAWVRDGLLSLGSSRSSSVSLFLTLELGVAGVSQSSQHHGSALPLQSWLPQKIYAGWDKAKPFRTEGGSLPQRLRNVCSGQHCKPSPDSKGIWGNVCQHLVPHLEMLKVSYDSLHCGHSLLEQNINIPRRQSFQRQTFWKLNGLKCSGYMLKFSSVLSWKSLVLCRPAPC